MSTSYRVSLSIYRHSVQAETILVGSLLKQGPTRKASTSPGQKNLTNMTTSLHDTPWPALMQRQHCFRTTPARFANHLI